MAAECRDYLPPQHAAPAHEFPTAPARHYTGVEDVRGVEMALVAAGCESGSPRHLVSRTRRIKEVEESADHPISRRNSKSKSADDGKQEKDRQEKRCHNLANSSDAAGRAADVCSGRSKRVAATAATTALHSTDYLRL